MFGWLPKRSRAERRKDIEFSLGEVGIGVAILIGGLCIIGAGAYFDVGAVLGIGVLVAGIGGYGLGQALLGFVIDTSVGMGWAIVLLGFCGLAYALFAGGRLLMAP